MNDEVLQCVYAAVDEANEDRAGLRPLGKSLDTPIQGPGNDLDSLNLINFLVAVEEALEDRFGVQVALSDDRAVTREPSPLESIGTLVEYSEELLGEARGDA